MMPPLVVATSNPHKLDELRAIFSKFSIPIQGLHELGLATPLQEPAEVGRTFEANASIKALSYAEQTGRLCLADDSGLEIDALNNEPGVISSHYTTGGVETDPPTPRAQRDLDNNALILRKLEGVPPEKRTARFVCVMALACPPHFDPPDAAVNAQPYHAEDELANLLPRLREHHERPHLPHVLLIARGDFKGRIGTPPRVPSGKHGFGYDPLFLVGPDFIQTAAELDPETKNKRSHRASAANLMADLLIRAGLASPAGTGLL